MDENGFPRDMSVSARDFDLILQRLAKPPRLNSRLAKMMRQYGGTSPAPLVTIRQRAGTDPVRGGPVDQIEHYPVPFGTTLRFRTSDGDNDDCTEEIEIMPAPEWAKEKGYSILFEGPGAGMALSRPQAKAVIRHLESLLNIVEHPLLVSLKAAGVPISGNAFSEINDRLWELDDRRKAAAG